MPILMSHRNKIKIPFIKVIAIILVGVFLSTNTAYPLHSCNKSTALRIPIKKKTLEKLQIIQDEQELLKEYKYHETEEDINLVFQEKIRQGMTPYENNAIKGSMRGSSEAIIMGKQSTEDIIRWTALGKKIKSASAFSAGGLSTRTKGLFNAAFSFVIPGLDANPHSFLELKFAAAAKARDDLKRAANDPELQQDEVIMVSFQTADTVKELLKDNDYFGYGKENVKVFKQGMQIRLNPTDKFLKEYRKKKAGQLRKAVKDGKMTGADMQNTIEALDRGIATQMGKAGDPLRTQKGNLVFNPAGHWDFIKWIVLSNVLAELKRNETKFIFYSHMNNPAGKVSDELKGLFEEEIIKAKKENRPEPVFMTLLGDNRGEKGGLYADITYLDGRKTTQIVEKPAFTKEASESVDKMSKEEVSRLYPYFNTGMFLLSVDGLFNQFKLSDEYDKKLSFEELTEIVNAVDIPVYIDVKETEETIGATEYIYVGLQLERYTGDFTTIWPYIAVVIDRDDQFVPIKTPNEVDLAGEVGKEKMRILAEALQPVKDYLASGENVATAGLLMQQLQEAIESGNKIAVRTISGLLIEQGQAALNLLKEELKSSDDIRVRLEIAYILGEIGDQVAVEALQNALAKDGQAAFVRALGRIGGVSAEKTLIGLLRSRDRNIRNSAILEAAAEGLSRMQSEKAIGLLIEVSGDKHERSRVRQAATQALGNFDDPRAEDALNNTLSNDSDPLVRKASAIGLRVKESINRVTVKGKTLALLTPAKKMKAIGHNRPKKYASFPSDVNNPVGNGVHVLFKNDNEPIKPGTKVVIGAAGMIGYEAALQLVNQDEEVVTVDNLLLGSPANDNIPGVKLLRQDSSSFCRQYRPEDYKKINGIVYLGGYSSEPQFVTRGFPQWLNWTGSPEEIAIKWNKMVDELSGSRKIDKITPEEVMYARINTKAEFGELLRILYNDFSPELALYAGRFPHCVTQEVLTSLYEFKTVMDLAVMYDIRTVFASTSSFCKLFPIGELVSEVPTLDILDKFVEIKDNHLEEKKWITPYEFMKLSMELVAKHYHHEYEADVYASRNFSVYNAGRQELQKGRNANMVAQTIWAIENNQSVPIFIMPGDFGRDVIFVSDLAKGILHILKHAKWEGTPENSAAVFNVGLKKVWGINEMIASIMRALSMGDLEKNIAYRMPTPGFPGTMIGDSSKIQSIGWKFDYPFEKALRHIFFANETEYEADVKKWESEHKPVAINKVQLTEDIGFKEIAAKVYKNGVYVLLLNEDDSLRGLYTDRKKIGLPDIKIYQGQDLYEDKDKPDVCTKNTGKIEEVAWTKWSFDYEQKVVPLRYDAENRSLVFLNGSNEISVGRQLGWVSEEVEQDSNAIERSVSHQIEDLVAKRVLKKAVEGVYLTLDDNVLLIYNQKNDNVELVVAKPHAGVMSDPITNSTIVRGLIKDDSYEGQQLCKLHAGNMDFVIDEEGRPRWIEFPEEIHLAEESTALVALNKDSNKFTVLGRNTTTAISTVLMLGGDTVEQIQERLRSGRDRDRNFLGENDDLKEELIKANIEVIDEQNLSHLKLGRVLVNGIALLDRVVGPGGMLAKPVRFYDRYTHFNFEISHEQSDRIASAFNERPTLSLRGKYRIKNLDTGKEIIFHGLLGENIIRWGFYGGPGAAEHFKIERKDLIELLGYNRTHLVLDFVDNLKTIKVRMGDL
ncbi:MAG: HEAT repeat domain-containing protein [Candidatus Gorgyraea atricola]|nr:HEAT repeat domain-containing protein [Candidatus Gorgyraea atricola]